MKISVMILAFLSFVSVSVFAQTDNWLNTKSTHLIVYYKNAPESFIRQLTEKAEGYYNSIASDLGFIRYDFWLWDQRAKIYVYDDAGSYQIASGQPVWSVGCAIAKQKMIYTFTGAAGFFDAVLPHELGHIIFREFVGFDNYAVPIWLDEGAASYNQKIKYALSDKMVRESIATGDFIGIQQLSGFNPQLMDGQQVGLFYMEAVSIIDFLIRRFGRENFALFCQNLRDKKDLKTALAYVYSLGSIQELEQVWKNYLING
ncbi:MAG: peptidase MA family metallohydrolase [Candidatus Omnitrophota bacterium]